MERMAVGIPVGSTSERMADAEEHSIHAGEERIAHEVDVGDCKVCAEVEIKLFDQRQLQQHEPTQ
jgi:hypothetical protein